MVNLILEVPLEEYEEVGFLIEKNRKYVTVIALEKPSSLRLDLPKPGESYQVKDELFLSCSLNVGVWGPKGSFIIDPDDDGLVFHPPTKSSTQTITFDPRRRVFFRHGLWLIDVVYAINKLSTRVTEVRLEDTFRVFKEDDVFVVKRRIEHKLYPYRWPYVIRCYSDGRFQIALKRPILPMRILKRIRRYFWR